MRRGNNLNTRHGVGRNVLSESDVVLTTPTATCFLKSFFCFRAIKDNFSVISNMLFYLLRIFQWVALALGSPTRLQQRNPSQNNDADQGRLMRI